MTVDTAKMTVDEIRSELVERFGFSREAVDAIKGKSQLAELYRRHASGNSYEGIELDFTEARAPSLQPVPVEGDVSYTSDTWHDYVMSKLTPSELQDGKYPKADGLYRVAQLLLGPILYAGPVSSQWQNDGTDVGRASCVYLLRFNWMRDTLTGMKTALSQGLREFGATGACSVYNQPDKKFNVFPDAIAETRAKARALKTALQLKIVTADELPSSATAEMEKPARTAEELVGSPASASQKALIRTKVNQLEIKWEEVGLSSEAELEKITKSRASEIIRELTEIQRSVN